MEPKLGPLHQIAVPCRDLGESVAFYRDVLGLELIAEFPPGLAFFRLGSTRLLLEADADAVAGGGVLYFAVADIHAVRDALFARGVKFESEPHLIHRDADGTFGRAGEEEWMCFFKDPLGNVLSLAERRLAS